MATETRAHAPFGLPGRVRLSPLTITGFVVVALVAVWLAVNIAKTPADFYELLLIGVTNGAVYGLVALGYSLVYGILELINFAHGDVFMLGGMLVATLTVTVFTLDGSESAIVLWGAILAMLAVAMAFCGTLNATIELVAYRRLRHAPRLAPLITAIGMSFILQNVGLVWLDVWKGDVRPASVPAILPDGDIFSIAGVAYTWDKLIILLITVPVLVLLIWLVQRTRQGKAMRATAQDRDAAAMMGINVNRTISFTFLIAGALAGAAALLYALYITNVRFTEGFRLGLIAFTAAVVGGIGNLPGAVLGALLIGLIEAFNNGLGWHSPGSDWTQSIIFAILILVLVFRPEGLLGERTPEGA
jgi:branched-chain amino acid transport system permease protein